MSCNEDFWGEIMPVTRSFSLQSVVFLTILDKCPTSHPPLLWSSFTSRNVNGRLEHTNPSFTHYIWWGSAGSGRVWPTNTKIFVIWFLLCVCVHVCVCTGVLLACLHTMFVPGILGRQKRALDPLKLEPMITLMNSHVGAENQAQGLWKCMRRS